MRTGVAGLASLSSSTSSICISFREEPGSPGFCVEGGMPRSYARRVLPSSLSMMYPSFYARCLLLIHTGIARCNLICTCGTATDRLSAGLTDRLSAGLTQLTDRLSAGLTQLTDRLRAGPTRLTDRICAGPTDVRAPTAT